MSKRIIAAVLTLVMLLGMFPTAAFASETPVDAVEVTETPVNTVNQEESAVQAEESTEESIPEETVAPEPVEVTRAQWLQKLVQTFSMTVENEVYPDNYFVDLDSTSEYYYDMLLAVEFGVVDIPAGGSLYPDESATREFAATTLNFCLGFQPDPEITLTFSEAAEVANPYDLQIAIDRGWFVLMDGAFLPEQPITQAEADAMAADAAAVLAAAVIDEDYESVYTYTADVIEVPDGTKVEATDTELVIYNCPAELTEGCIFAVYFEGIPCIYAAETVQVMPNRTVVTVSTVDESLYYESMEAQGAVDAKFTDFVPEEGTEILYIDEDTGEEYEDAVEAEQAMAKRAQSISTNAAETVKLNRTIKVKQSLGAFGASGYIEVEIKNPKITYDISLSKKKVSVELNGDTNINFGFEADAMEALDLDEIKIGFFGVHGVGGITISISLEAKAAVYGSVSGKLTKGLEFSGGSFRMIKNFQKDSFSLVAEFSGKVGVIAKVGITDIPADALEGYFYAELGAKGTVKYTDYADATCTHVAFYMYFDAGYKASVKLGFYKKSWEDTIHIWDEDNSPVRAVHHYDNSVLVPGCTLGNSGSDTNNGYYTPTESPYWNSNWSGGDNSTGYNKAGEPVVVFDYSVNSNGDATITDYTGTATSLTIPDSIDGYPIVAIGTSAFSGCTGLRSVIIPDSVTSIGYRAFSGCTNLTSIQLPANLVSVSQGSFRNCSSLTYIRIPATLTTVVSGSSIREYGTFYGCTKLKTVVLESGMTTIPACLFVGADAIQSIVIPDTVTSIGNYAFYYAKGLKDVTFSQNLTEIGEYSFRGCSALETIDIPDSVTKLWHYAFADCTSLAEVKLSENLVTISTGTFKNCSALTSIKIPASLTTCQTSTLVTEEGTFYGCTNLKEIILEEGITAIPAHLFIGASSIESIVIPDTVTSIGNYAFYYAKGLKDVTFSQNLTEIGQYSFQGCSALETIDIPDSVTKLWHYAFADCTSLAEVKLSENLVTISTGTFKNCSALTSIKIPASLTTCQTSTLVTEKGTFYGCTNLKEIILEEGITAIPAHLFIGAYSIESIAIPDTVTSIGNYAFYYAKGLVSIEIPETVTSIGESVFRGCSGLQTVTWPSSLTTIPVNTFSGCTALTTVNLPDNLKTINNYAFNNCDSLVNFTMPDSVTTMNENVFYDCDALTEIHLSENLAKLNYNTFYDCDALTAITIPGSVTTIGSNCFYNCDALTSITIPGSVTTIGYNCFYDCDALTAITIPFGVTSIGNSCFQDCDALTTVDMSNSVTSLGTSAFYHCDLLKDVKLSRNLTTIPSAAFKECAELEQIVIPYFTTKIDANAFNASPKLVKVVVHDKLATITASAFSYADRTVFYGPTGSYAETWCTDNGYTFNENTAVATAVTLAEKTVSIAKGSTYLLNFSIDPADFADTIAFRSSNEGVVTVDETGKLTAVAVGTATIRINVGSTAASCKVTVTQAVTKLTLDKTTLALDVPNTYQLTAKITPTDATNQVLTWTSSNEAAATVDENGLVTAVGNGTAVITAATTDGSNLTASCTVTVTDPNNIPVSGITLDQTSVELEALETAKLTATITPEDAANKTLVWTSSDEAVATVDESGLVTAIAKGTATITAAATDESGVTAACTVTVTNTAHIVTSVEELESSHNYPLNCTDFWLYTVPGAEMLYVTFDAQTYIEDDFDFLYIFDGEGNQIGSYTGDQLAGQTVEIPGDTVKIQLDSDDIGTDWGFKVTEITVKEHTHDYEDTVTEPTCTEQGYTTHTCTICGHSYVDSYTATVDHDYVDGVCSVCGDEQAQIVASGWSGATQWTLTDDGVLTVYGSGNMKNYSYNGGQPWLNKGVDITSVVIEEGVTSVGSGAFRNLTTLESVTFPATTLTKMGEAAFYGSGLKSVEIPASLWTIQPYTFKNCANLTSVKFNEGNLQKISDGAFYGTAITELVLPDCLGILDVYAFKGCDKLTSITIGSGITELREAVFYGTAIPTIEIPEGITKIGPYAFKNCVKLETVDMPESLTSVGEAIFYACTALKIVELPDAVTTIGNYAFRKCAAITTLKLSAELVTVGECAFYGCTGLTELVIPDKVTTIKPYAFKTCSGLTSVTLGSSVESIGEGAFNTCTGLKTIVFPASLKTIGSYCFSGSYNLWKLTFEGDAPSIGEGAFKGLNAYAYYPSGNATWTSANMLNYGGKITWTAK